jgi:hypothetical protein
MLVSPLSPLNNLSQSPMSQQHTSRISIPTPSSPRMSMRHTEGSVRLLHRTQYSRGDGLTTFSNSLLPVELLHMPPPYGWLLFALDLTPILPLCCRCRPQHHACSAACTAAYARLMVSTLAPHVSGLMAQTLGRWIGDTIQFYLDMYAVNQVY